MRVLSVSILSVLALEDDHISVLQQKVSADMHDRASRVSSFSSQLDAAVAGKKKSKCNAVEAAELVSCLRIGDVSALDLLTQGESFDDAVEAISSRVGDADCNTLRSDMRCVQMNPCYTKVLKAMPLTFDISEQNVKVKTLCSQYKNDRILEESNITWGMVCGESPRNLCGVMYDNVQEIKSDYDACDVTCTTIGGTEAATESATFHLASKYDEMCSEAQTIKLEADCKAAAETIDGDKRLEFKTIRFQKRPAGCFKYNGKVYWNKVRTGALKKGRIPLCLSDKLKLK